VLSGAPENALVVSESTVLRSREAWEHLEILGSTGDVYRSVWEVCVRLLDCFTFCRCVGSSQVMCSKYSSRMCTCVQRQAMVTTCDPWQPSRMRSYQRHSCSSTSCNNQVCPLLALTRKVSDELACSLATPEEHGAMQCRYLWQVMRLYDRPCRQSWNCKIHHHTYRGHSPNDKIWCRLTPGLHPPGS